MIPIAYYVKPFEYIRGEVDQDRVVYLGLCEDGSRMLVFHTKGIEKTTRVAITPDTYKILCELILQDMAGKEGYVYVKFEED